MSVLAGYAAQFWAMEPRVGEWQFHARKRTAVCTLCRCGRPVRNDVPRQGLGVAAHCRSKRTYGRGGDITPGFVHRITGHRPNQEPLSPPTIVFYPTEATIMAYQRNPSDPTRSDLANDPYRPSDPYRDKRADSDLRDPVHLDDDLQVDPELAEGRASSGRIVVYAIAIAVVLGAVFYGLDNASFFNHDGAASTAQNSSPSSPSSPPAAPPGMRDVTPHANSQPGTTTGAAPAQPQMPPSSAPANADRSGSQSSGGPANSAAPGK
jgi:hypothetical protein